jgi:hypothetical protein
MALKGWTVLKKLTRTRHHLDLKEGKALSRCECDIGTTDVRVILKKQDMDLITAIVDITPAAPLKLL